MSDITIRVENLSKQYKIGAPQQRHDALKGLDQDLIIERHDTLKDLLTHGLKGLFHRNSQSEIFWALKDVSFEVKQGEVVGVIGSNGAGKSTLLKILSRITKPTEGRAEIYGRVVSLLEVGTGFHPELTGRENVYLNGAILGMKKAEIDRKFDEIVDFSGVEKFIDTPVKHYSSGMSVRLAFAVAAHLEPEILIVDEVLAVGDATFQKKCLGKIENVARAGRTVLIVSHNMPTIQGLCSKCFLLKGGQIIAKGSPRSVVEQYCADVSSNTSTPLWQRKDRKGTGEIRFIDASILDANGRRIDVALSGQDVNIAVSYRARDDKPISGLDVHIGFFSTFGQYMFTCSSEESGHPFDLFPSSGQVTCHIPELPLTPGAYVFNLFSTVRGVVSDWVQQVGPLTVTAGDYFGTGKLKDHEQGFLVKHKWSIEPHVNLSDRLDD